jgi:hypothetical protein
MRTRSSRTIRSASSLLEGSTVTASVERRDAEHDPDREPAGEADPAGAPRDRIDRDELA